jgi:phenylpyruvate tautomerase PptA (4-oxalocrotonate tautomerase family)
MIMPLLRFDVIEGRDEKSLRKLLDATHQAMVEAFDVPERDRYQIVHQHSPHEMIIEDTGLGFERSKNLVVISVTSKQRTDEQKQKFYRLLVKELGESCGIEPNDIMVSIVTNGDADWSFGMGEAQFLTGEL